MQPPSLLLLLLCHSVVKTRVLRCGDFPEPCANGGTCLSLSQGQGSCQCAPGFLGETCQFPDPCQDGQLCQNGGSCQALLPALPGSPSLPSPLAPSFSCTCPSGFTGQRCQAQLKDPCSSFCSKMGRCHIQASGRPRCSCLPGWTGEQCQLRDFCSANPCVNGGVCLATYPQIQCRCPPGFEGHACEHDINECFLDPGPCPKGTSCHNTLGSFWCHCPTGQEGPRCELQPGPCPPTGCPNGGTCQLVPGRDSTLHLCLCPQGFRGPSCEVNPDDCAGHQCQNGGTCLDGLSTYTCLCPEAWTGWDCSEDVDECEAQGPPRCQNGGTCQNSAGSFHCVCVSGWGGTGCEENLDDCVAATCAPGSTCIDRVGSFSCLCPPGRTGLLCHMEDMCLSQPCHGEAQCSTNPLTGSPLCLCQPGYSGPTCHQDLDECQMAQQGPSPCEHGGSCLNTPGSFDCLCPPGYTGSRCEADHNECLSQPCHLGSTCLDLLATFHCLCPPGTEVSSLCQNGGLCIDSGSSYFCHCPPGFQGSVCQDRVNPCESRPCQHGATCMAQPTGYLCQCAPGYNGQNCSKESNACQSQPCHNHGTCTPKPGGFYCTCPPGFVGLRCEGDVDECLDQPCHPPGTAACHSLANAFYCQCLPGYTGQWCEVETDPCQSQPCSNGGSCETTAGPPLGFTCHCLQGFEGPTCNHKAPSCGHHHCHHGGLCLPSPKPGFPPRCACLNGYGGPDCLTPPAPHGCGPPSPCLHNGSCSEIPGLGSPAFRCSCPPSSPGPRCQRPGAKGCEGRGGDGACDAGCSGPGGNWDGGDCSLGVPDPWKGCPSHSRCWLLFRDGQCHPQCDSAECLFDGYDCETPPACTPAYDQYCRDHFHNEHCEKGCNTAECGWDGGDCRPKDGDSEWGPSLALLVVLSPPALDQQLLALARVLSLTLRVGLWVRKDSDGKDMVYPYPGTQAEEELGGTLDPSHQERAAPQTQPGGKETDSLSTGFVVVMGVDLSRCGPDHPASRCPWDPGLLLRFLAAMAAVGALEHLLPGPLLAAHPRAGTAPPTNQLPWPVLCSPVAGVLLLALGALLVLQLIRRRRREHGALWLPPGFIRRPRTQPTPRRRRPPLGEDSIGLKALKPEAEVDEDGVVMCSGTKEGEEVGQAEEVASPSKCQLCPLRGDCQELPQAAMLTPPQESEMDVPDVDTRGPDGVTALMSAVCCGGVESRTFQGSWLGSPEPWEPLLGGGACPQAHTVGTGETPLHLAARFSRPTAARRLLEAGANPNQPDRAGRTPLHTAVAADAREVCQLLLRSRQTAVDARTEDGTTALMLAARLAVEDLVEELIAAQADVGARDKWGKTALHWAAAVNNARAARSLLQAGADKDAQDGREQTPLFLAAREGAVEVAQLLLGLGAARGLRDHAGLAPGDIARQRNHWDLLTLLEGAGSLEARHKATPGRGAGAFPRSRTASGSLPPRRGGALSRNRTLSAGAGPRGGGACPQTQTLSLEWAARGGGAYSHCRSPSKGAGGGLSPGGRRFSPGMRGPRPNPAVVPGRSGAASGGGGGASADDWPCDWVTLRACGSNTPIPPPCLTPSPERGSPQVAWDSPTHQVTPLNAGGEGQK
uniref:neurogenic locus notch homolog protein 4 isoform X3 n=1 Tax=Panthera onca TaxID=9690 RepID=UPI0029532D64|nr:neurogenic locus notch homolog protein 4 isoform X3 [Panthera onca]